MDALIATGRWDPRDGVAGLERVLAADDVNDTIVP
jgi:hypothetical protein